MHRSLSHAQPILYDDVILYILMHIIVNAGLYSDLFMGCNYGRSPKTITMKVTTECSRVWICRSFTSRAVCKVAGGGLKLYRLTHMVHIM